MSPESIDPLVIVREWGLRHVLLEELLLDELLASPSKSNGDIGASIPRFDANKGFPSNP